MNASQDLGLDVKIARSLPSNHMQAYYHKRDGIIQISSSERRMVSFGINIDGLVTIDCDDSGRIVDVEIVLSRNIQWAIASAPVLYISVQIIPNGI
jgi:hypothetical protein